MYTPDIFVLINHQTAVKTNKNKLKKKKQKSNKEKSIKESHANDIFAHCLKGNLHKQFYN